MSHSSNPAQAAAAVTPSDSVDIPQGRCRALYVGVTGNVSVVMNGATVVFVAVPAGSILPVVASRVNLTGTTAASIVALF